MDSQQGAVTAVQSTEDSMELLQVNPRGRGHCRNKGRKYSGLADQYVYI